MRRLTILICAIVLFHAGLAYGQAAGTATAAAIWGTVKDSTGGVLPGVVVTLEGRSLLGSQVAVSNEQGIYRFPSLPPGEFKLRFELQGFSTMVRDGVTLTLAFTATVDMEMRASNVEQSVVVVGSSPVIDAVNTRQQTSFNKDMLASLPSARDLWAILAESPAVQMSRIDVGGSAAGLQSGYRAYGTSGQNVPIVEGVIALEADGGTGFYWDYGSFDEVNVGATGQSGEMANPGVRTVLISKSGGNEFHADLYADYENERLQSNNIDEDQMAKGVLAGSNRVHAYSDINVNGGGYIKKDTLWWFGSYRRQKIEVKVANFPAEPQLFEMPNYTGKLTYQLPKSNRLVGYMMIGRKVTPNRLVSHLLGTNAFFAKKEYSWGQINPAWIGKMEWNKSFGSNLFVEARVARWGVHTTANMWTDEPHREDLVTREVSGGSRDWQVYHYRPQATGALSYYKDGWAGSHNIKLGWEIQKDQERQIWEEAFPNNLVHVLRSGAASEVYQMLAPLDSVNRLYWNGLYLTDTWSAGRLSLNFGVRFDSYRSAYPDQERDTNRFAEGVSIPGVDDIITMNVLAPRVGLSWDMTGGGRNVLKTTYGRYYFNPTRNVAATVNPNNSPQWRRYAWTDGNGDLVWQSGEEGRLLETRGGIATGAVDPALKSTYSDEATLWYERELGNGFGMRTGIVYKRQARLSQTVNVLNPPNGFDIPVTVVDPGVDGRTGTNDDGVLQLFNLQPSLIGQTLNVLRNAPGYDAEFRTWEIAAQRRFAKRWSLNGSFAVTWRDDFNSIPYRPNDSPQSRMLPIRMAKLMGSYEPGWGVRLTPLVRFQSGDPYARTVTAVLNYGNQTVEAEPLGSRRKDDIFVFDLRAERKFNIGQKGSVSGFVDGFNMFNTNAVVDITTTTGTSFLRPITIVPPRIFRVGAKMSW